MTHEPKPEHTPHITLFFFFHFQGLPELRVPSPRAAVDPGQAAGRRRLQQPRAAQGHVGGLPDLPVPRGAPSGDPGQDVPGPAEDGVLVRRRPLERRASSSAREEP